MHETAIVLSVASTTITAATFPIGKVFMVPTQVPANRLCLWFGCCLTEFTGASFASDFVFGLVVRFGFGLADCSGTGVGVSVSEIGAGERFAVLSSSAAVRQQVRVGFINWLGG